MRGSVAVAALCLCAPASPSAWASTRAGTTIANTATLTFNDGVARSVPSNSVALTTAEVLDVAIAAERASVVVSDARVAVAFLVTNTGNGDEDFALAFASDATNVSVAQVAIDANGDGIYDASVDRVLAPGAALPLAAGGQARLFVLIDGRTVGGDTRISATATARTGNGTPGTVFVGRGDNGGDAVVGKSGAIATASSLLALSAAIPTLVKSQSVFAPDGGTRATKGAIVTYTLVASFPAATRGAVVDDPIPAGTDYVPGSITLDGRTLSDARDGDTASVDQAGIHVALGDVAGASNRTIQFSVKIQ